MRYTRQARSLVRPSDGNASTPSSRIVIDSPALEASDFEVGGLRLSYAFYESGLAINVMWSIDGTDKCAVGFKL